MVGTTVSHYKILEKLGEGGMGVVYKALDTRLNRTVALKFLPPGLHTDEPTRARFLQEAQSASVLNHPNICTVHDIIEEGDRQAIVMELVEGTTLRSRIAESVRAPGAQGLPVMDAVAYAIQIGEALQEAHAKGIIHRDVKPDNIMVNEKNQAKVMDFGLAKLRGSLKLTRTSSTVGTLAYMSPEQIEGNPVDARSDIFSFGIVLYEMFSGGHAPFRGEHEAALIYSILNEEPEPIQTYRADIPPELAHIVNRALEKDPDDRYQSALDMVIDLRRIKKHSTRVLRTSRVRAEGAAAGEATPARPRADGQPEIRQYEWSVSSLLHHRYAWLGLAAVVLVAAGIYVVRTVAPSGPPPLSPLQVTFDQLTDRPGIETFPDISPDGSFVVYTQYASDRSAIVLQRVGGGKPIILTGDAKTFDRHPRFSPDGQRIVFSSNREGGGVFVMGSTGESVRRLSDVGQNPVWSPDGKAILCASEAVSMPDARQGTSQLWSIDTETGAKRLVFSGDAVQPDVSPHGHRIAYWAMPLGSGDRDVWTMPLEGGEPVRVTHDAFVDWSPAWSPDGRYLYFSSDRGGSMNLWRVPIDEKTGDVLGELEPMTTPAPWSGLPRISRDGRQIVYTARASTSNIQRVGFDPVREKVTGEPNPVTQGSKEIYYCDISPDGQQLVYGLWGKQEDIYTIRSDGTDLRQLTDDSWKDRRPRWSPDGTRILFYSNRLGRYEAWSISPDGIGLSQLTKTSGASVHYPEWLGDGGHIAYNVQGKGTFVLDIRRPNGERTPQAIASINRGDTLFQLETCSPDGLALCGNLKIQPTGRTLPGLVLYSLATGRYEALTDSGVPTAWLNDSRRILYVKDEAVRILDTRTGASHEILAAQPNRAVMEAKLSGDNRMLYFTSGTHEGDIWLATVK